MKSSTTQKPEPLTLELVYRELRALRERVEDLEDLHDLERQLPRTVMNRLSRGRRPKRASILTDRPRERDQHRVCSSSRD